MASCQLSSVNEGSLSVGFGTIDPGARVCFSQSRQNLGRLRTDLLAVTLGLAGAQPSSDCFG